MLRAHIYLLSQWRIRGDRRFAIGCAWALPKLCELVVQSAQLIYIMPKNTATNAFEYLIHKVIIFIVGAASMVNGQLFHARNKYITR